MSEDIKMSNIDKEIIYIFERKLDEWLDTEEHKSDCAAWDEGQWCCLENTLIEDPLSGNEPKPGRIKIIDLLKQSLKLKEDSLKANHE